MNARLISLSALALISLSACATSDPPANELAEEVIDSLDPDEVTDAEKACMYDVVESFELTDDEQRVATDLGDAADKANDGNAEAIEILDRFEAELTACNS